MAASATLGSMTVLPEAPALLESGPVRLTFDEIVRPDWHAELVPFYHFDILLENSVVVGHINLRIGDTRHISESAGHIGFAVDAAHRGHGYSYHACMALSPFAIEFYDHVIVTANPENIASNRIIERLGAIFMEEIDVSSSDPSYRGGARRRRRYEWRLESRD